MEQGAWRKEHGAWNKEQGAWRKKQGARGKWHGAWSKEQGIFLLSLERAAPLCSRLPRALSLILLPKPGVAKS